MTDRRDNGRQGRHSYGKRRRCLPIDAGLEGSVFRPVSPILDVPYGETVIFI